jgi:hypothetical protein
MNDDLAPVSLDDVLAHGGLGETTPAPAPTILRSPVVYGPDLDEIRRTELQRKALSSGRIRGWTGMSAYDLWREWVARFGGDEDLAREAALRTCERMVRDKCKASQERLYRIKRLLLGWHARGRLDERCQQRGLEGVWWTRRDEAIDDFEYVGLPLPWKPLVRVLKYLACGRARIRPTDL